ADGRLDRGAVERVLAELADAEFVAGIADLAAAARRRAGQIARARPRQIAAHAIDRHVDADAGHTAVEVERRRSTSGADQQQQREQTRHAQILRQMLDDSDRPFYGTEQMPRTFLALSFSVAVTRKIRQEV